MDVCRFFLLLPWGRGFSCCGGSNLIPTHSISVPHRSSSVHSTCMLFTITLVSAMWFLTETRSESPILVFPIISSALLVHTTCSLGFESIFVRPDIIYNLTQRRGYQRSRIIFKAATGTGSLLVVRTLLQWLQVRTLRGQINDVLAGFGAII